MYIIPYPMMTRKLLFSLLVALTIVSVHAADKPKLTLDEFFNSVEFKTVKLSSDGNFIVIATVRADWEENIFRKDLWLYRNGGHAGGALTQLTQSGHDSDPQWSPDGHFSPRGRQPRGETHVRRSSKIPK
jgi:dipeptidyl aminopeptidase/acylaminoacyl peptidase